MLKGYADSVALEITFDILAKLADIAVIHIAKNKMVLDQELLTSFKLGKKVVLYDYLAILETQTGLQYKLIKHIRAKNITLTFQGLYQYDEVSRLMMIDYKAIMERLGGECMLLVRLDVCFDENKPFNVQRIAKLMNRRVDKKKTWNTAYLKTAKEKKTNRHLDIKHYKKFDDMYRLEFVFHKRYLQGSKEDVKKCISKTIKKALGKPFKFGDFFA
jgi:hypothetical protein